MANSVVKVTENAVNDGFIVVIGADGTISPSREAMEAYLSSRTGETDIQVMQIKQSDGKSVDVTLDTLTYVASHEEEGLFTLQEMDEISKNLHNFRMDHDYTPLTSPPRDDSIIEEVVEEVVEEDELAQTLSILEGNVIPTPPKPKSFPKVIKKVTPQTSAIKIVHTAPSVAPLSVRAIKPKTVISKPSEDYTDIDFILDSEESDTNDSDFELEKPLGKVKIPQKRTRTKFPETTNQTQKLVKIIQAPERPKLQPVSNKIEPESVRKEPTPEVSDNKTPDKKVLIKKDKKPPKPSPDDFALFSTPDIIRRVGGKQESATPTTPESPKSVKVAKIFSSPPKLVGFRNSLDSKEKIAVVKESRLSLDSKMARTLSGGDLQLKKLQSDMHKIDECATDAFTGHLDESLAEKHLNALPTAEDIRVIIQNEATKSFTNDLVIPEQSHQQISENSHMTLAANALDLDQSLLDNINSDLIPEDILLQVANSLVANPELQNAIEKSLVDGGIQLDPSHQGSVGEPSLEPQHYDSPYMKQVEQGSPGPMVGTHVVRPDGRVVVIPPLERPATRSRNKKVEVEPIELPKAIARPLDSEHVSGAELDSSSDEEKSDDDPDKLWCICNQPHNNRFMICCDHCEEWYHGKCVNVTKVMGKMMEQEGKEWICVYCKDSSLKRPSAAARRIRKASRNSSTDMTMEEKQLDLEPEPIAKSVEPDCLVCGKPSRINSIYCSDPCILQHAKGVEKVVVYDRKSGKILNGNNAPSAANLDKWLQQNPNYEVVRPQKTNTKSPATLTQSRLKIVKNPGEQGGVSLAVQRKGVEVGVLHHTPKQSPTPQQKQVVKKPISALKLLTKQSPTSPRVKLIQPVPLVRNPPAVTTPVKPKVVQQPQVKPTTPTQVPSAKQPMPQKTPKSRQVEEASTQLGSKENIRDNVKRTLLEQLMNRIKEANDIKLEKEAVAKISLEIESQLYKCFGDTGQKYRNKYRSLIFNIKDTKNETLWRRICEKSVNPYQLVRLSSDDLASQELALWRERENKHQLEMITKSELEQLGRKSQIVFKTHKGEQELEDDRPTDAVQTTEVITTLGSNTSTDSLSDHKKDVLEKDKKNSKHGRDKSHDRKSKRERDRKSRKRTHRSSSHEGGSHHKRSKSKDSHHSSEKNRSRSRDRDRHRKTSHKNSKHKKELYNDITTGKLDKKSKEILEQLVDSKIVPPLEDRLWKHVQQEDITTGNLLTAPVAESDSDHEPTSTVTIPTPPRVAEVEEQSNQKHDTKEVKEDLISNTSLISENEEGSKSPPPRSQQDFIWKGSINMVDVAEICITAHEVSGDCSGLGKELPPSLDVVGRISPDTVWDYISKMKCSNSKAISLLRLNATNEEEKMPYIALYSYLSSRNRLGVIKTVNKAVKDFYILPLSNQKPIPQALLPLNGPGFEESRPALLLGIIVRDRRKRPIYPLPSLSSKRIKTDSHSTSPATQPTVPVRSYTPPPNVDPRTKRPPAVPPSKVPIPSELEDEDVDMEGGDEPYTPEDSDPDSTPSTSKDLNTSTTLNSSEISNLLTNAVKASSFLDTGLISQTFEPFKNKFNSIPGLEESTPNPQDIQRKMEELDQRIALEKAQIQNMSQDIVASSTTSDIGTTALASIALPSNLQQILDSIKGINPPDVSDPKAVKADRSAAAVGGSASDLTIPLLLPKISSRSQTIPLHIPTTPRPPTFKSEKPTESVLSTLSEEDLMRKAAEMLGETETEVKPKVKISFESKKNFASTKDSKLDMMQPPVPGVGD